MVANVVANPVAASLGAGGIPVHNPAVPGLASSVAAVSGMPGPGGATGPMSDAAALEVGWDWLRRAAEMAALSGSLPLIPGGPGWPCYPRIAMRIPGFVPGSISAARKFTTIILERWGAADRGSDVAVVVSELLSNAVRHGVPPSAVRPADGIRLGLMHSGPSILCAVTDPSKQPPVPREAGWLDESGRGLQVVASLSDGWGTCMDVPGQPGKVVWATFRTVQQER
ncbi:MAG: ATP-binding protein [Streptosporangiaceae bacterium]